MTVATTAWLFAALAILGALLAFSGYLQHFVLRWQVLHLAVYVSVVGLALCVFGLVGLFVAVALASQRES
jgi:hypothetical protein